VPHMSGLRQWPPLCTSVKGRPFQSKTGDFQSGSSDPLDAPAKRTLGHRSGVPW
jgi:hypothetical protein